MSNSTDSELAETLTLLNELDVAELRDLSFQIGGSGRTPSTAYPHQLEAIYQIEAGSGKKPPVSGILHYATGAGKTRIALELIARTLKENPDHRFVWGHVKSKSRTAVDGQHGRAFPNLPRGYRAFLDQGCR